MSAQSPITQLILASRSPRRIALLAEMGVHCEVRPADIDESVLADEAPLDYVRRLAQAKAQTVAAAMTQQAMPAPNERPQHTQSSPLPVLAADTTVALEHLILGKPMDATEAMRMLQQLNGRSHWVHTAVALWQAGQVRCLVSSTRVEMMTVPDEVLADYVASGEPMDKAGAYGIQGRAGRWIRQIEGSYSGVMGLPVHETAQLLQAW